MFSALKPSATAVGGWTQEQTKLNFITIKQKGCCGSNSLPKNKIKPKPGMNNAQLKLK